MAEYTNLCYYHAKIEAGLIDEPEMEIPYAEVWVEDQELLQVFMERTKYYSDTMCPDGVKEDARNYASMGYRNTVATWESDSVAWVTHCSLKIKHRVIDFMRKEVLHGQRFQGLPDGEDILDYMNPEILVIEKEKHDGLRDAISDAMLGMTDREHWVLWRRMITHDPATLQELADRWGCSRESIRRDEKRIINKLREEIAYE
jgi:RNA polymerase sigma factor (sigma-70 family)